MYFHTAISKLTLYAYKNPSKEAECLELIDLLSKYSTYNLGDGNYGERGSIQTFLDALKNISGDIFINNSKNLSALYRLSDLERNNQIYTTQSLKTLTEIIKLDSHNKELIADLYRIFELGVEEKLEYDLSNYVAAVSETLERAQNFSKFITENKLKSFPFMRIAQNIIKDAVELKKINDPKIVESKLPNFRESLYPYYDFAKVNDKLQYFNEAQLSPLVKAINFGKQTAEARQLFVDIELYDYDPWASMLFSN